MAGGDAEAIVVGGGIGGLAAALAVQRSGAFARIRVLERADEFSEVGAGLQLGPNAIRALRALGIDEAIDDYAFYPRRLVMMNAVTGDMVTAVDLDQGFRDRFGAPYVVMHRSDLLALLLDEVKQHDVIELRSGVAVDAVLRTGPRAELRAADGEEFAADLVIGADGLRSVLREAVAGPTATVGTPYVAYRGTLPFDRVAALAGGEDMLLWAGPRMHLVQYPIRRGELYNQVVCFASDRYDPGRGDAGDGWGTPDELDERFTEACDTVRAGAELIDRTRRWQMIDREPIPRWVRDRVALVGDAAHPMLQYVAQGACQALEDAVALEAALGGATTGTPPDVDEALRRYEEVRVPRASRVQRTARAFGELIHLGGVAADLRDRYLSPRPHDAHPEMEWLYSGT